MIGFSKNTARAASGAKLRGNPLCAVGGLKGKSKYYKTRWNRFKRGKGRDKKPDGTGL